MTLEATADKQYPVDLTLEYPEALSRWKIFFKWFLAIPHFVILYALNILVSAITFVAFFAILFTKRYPRGMFDIVVNCYRWQLNVLAYVGLLRDDYPPFSWEADRYPLAFAVDYPEQLSRWMIFVKWLLAAPHLIALAFLGVIAILLWIAAWFVILFTGRMPRGIFDFLVGVARWSYRVNAYTNLLRDDYPPFRLR